MQTFSNTVVQYQTKEIVPYSNNMPSHSAYFFTEIFDMIQCHY